MKKNLVRGLFGLLFIGAGVGYFGNLIGWWSSFTIFFPGWWTLFLIIPAVCSFINDGFNIFNSCLFVLGVALLLSSCEIVKFRQTIYIALAVILVFIGIVIIFKPLFTRDSHVHIYGNGNVYNGSKVSGKSYEEYSTTFSEKNLNYDNREFTGACFKTYFGSLTIDLRNAIINNDCTVKMNVKFGEATIFVPDNIIVEIDGNSIFGEVSNSHRQSTGDCRKLIIKTDLVFGEIDVK